MRELRPVEGICSLPGRISCGTQAGTRTTPQRLGHNPFSCRITIEVRYSASLSHYCDVWPGNHQILRTKRTITVYKSMLYDTPTVPGEWLLRCTAIRDGGRGLPCR